MRYCCCCVVLLLCTRRITSCITGSRGRQKHSRMKNNSHAGARSMPVSGYVRLECSPFRKTPSTATAPDVISHPLLAATACCRCCRTECGPRSLWIIPLYFCWSLFFAVGSLGYNCDMYPFTLFQILKRGPPGLSTLLLLALPEEEAPAYCRD